jgi:uncharacterized short protein YbdD (DUF466 family)
MLGRRSGGQVDGRTTAKQRLLSMISQVVGMPDYPAHVEHLRRCHPEQPVPTERQFYEEFVRARYGDGPTRCC